MFNIVSALTSSKRQNRGMTSTKHHTSFLLFLFFALCGFFSGTYAIHTSTNYVTSLTVYDVTTMSAITTFSWYNPVVNVTLGCTFYIVCQVIILLVIYILFKQTWKTPKYTMFFSISQAPALRVLKLTLISITITNIWHLVATLFLMVFQGGMPAQTTHTTLFVTHSSFYFENSQKLAPSEWVMQNMAQQYLQP